MEAPQRGLIIQSRKILHGVIEYWAIALVYMLLACLGQMQAISPGNVTPVWPASGFALVVVLWRGYRVWPALWLGNFLGNIYPILETNTLLDCLRTILTGVAIGPGDVAQACLGAYWIRRFCPQGEAFDRVLDVFIFIGTQAVACLFSSTLGVLALCMGDVIDWKQYAYTWVTWYLGDGMGVILVAPLLLTASKYSSKLREPRQAMEAVLICALTGACACFVFMPNPMRPTLRFLVTPFVLWAAIRVNQFVVSVVVLFIFSIALWCTNYLPELAGEPDKNVSLMILQLHIGTLAVTGAVVAAALNERRQAALEQQHLLLKLQTSEDRFQTFMDHGPFLAFMKDEAGRFIYINRSFERYFRVERNHVIGKTDWDIVPPDMASKFAADDQQVLHHTSPLYFEEDGTAQNGTNRQLSTVKFVLRDSSGSRMLGGLSIDVTDRKLTEAKLQLRESQLSGILENTEAVIYLKDDQGRYLLVNQRYRELFQKGDELLIGKTDREIFPEQFARAFNESDAKVWQNQRSYDFEEDAQHPDGSVHHYWSVKFPVRGAEGDMIALGGISTDVSELKKTQQSLLQKQDLLRNLIKVQEDEKLFLCHEIHDGLIQHAIGSLMLLEGCRHHNMSPENIANIDEAITSLRRGIDDGRRAIRGIRTSVLDDSGLEAAIEDLINQFSNSGIMITSHCDSSLGRLPDQFQTAIYRVIQEALNNAKKHSGTDVVRIELQKENNELRLSIRDFGCGFDVSKSRQKGFGLLGMTERIRLLGGECVIQSEIDEGTQISARVPLPADHDND